jgi:hypothetical protein
MFFVLCCIQVELPTWYGAGSNLLLLSNYYAPEGGMVPVIAGVVAQGGNIQASDRGVETRIVSGKAMCR